MSSSLAVRYRPRSFDEVVGQPKAITILKGLVKSRNTSRGIMFYGPRGTGKTSLARILAHALNCEQYDNVGFKTCGTCSYCESVELVKKGSYPGTQEMNFSETRGIDTVRAILDELEYESTSKTRVVILDEMHNMTSQAQNAILKALEEPPEGTLFILITTEPGKVIPPIRSRCLPIHCVKVDIETIFSHLQKLCSQESKEIAPYALKYVATHADGILRDAVTLLESIFYLKESNPDCDLTDQKILERMLASKETRTSTLADYLLTGVYGCKYSLSLVALQKLLKDPEVNIRLFFEKCYEYHLQTFHMIIDPPQKQTDLFSDIYADWYASVKDALESKKFFLVLSSAEKILEELFELNERLKSYDADTERLVTAFTVRMVHSVLDSKSEAYTKFSPIHRTYAPEAPEVK